MRFLHKKGEPQKEIQEEELLNERLLRLEQEVADWKRRYDLSAQRLTKLAVDVEHLKRRKN